MVLDEYKQHLNNIDVELLKTAEETICDKISVYTELPGFSLRFDDSGYLCLHIERIVDIEPPNVITDDNGEIINGGCNIDHKHIFFDERITKQTQTNSNVPEDFTFALTWNCYGISSYDSQTGKLVKTTDATNPDDYVTYYQLTDQDKEYIYNLIAPLDVGSYPEVYDPQNGMSAPSMTLILTVYCNGTQKTIKAENIALSFTSEDEKGQDFLSVCEAICNRLTATEEWKELPDYENLYD